MRKHTLIFTLTFSLFFYQRSYSQLWNSDPNAQKVKALLLLKYSPFSHFMLYDPSWYDLFAPYTGQRIPLDTTNIIFFENCGLDTLPGNVVLVKYRVYEGLSHGTIGSYEAYAEENYPPYTKLFTQVKLYATYAILWLTVKDG